MAPAVLDRGNPGAPEPIGAPYTGVPAARASDGRWAFTLYQGEASWVHALDTVTRTTRRFDVPRLRGNDLTTLTLRGGTLRVGDVAAIPVR